MESKAVGESKHSEGIPRQPRVDQLQGPLFIQSNRTLPLLASGQILAKRDASRSGGSGFDSTRVSRARAVEPRAAPTHTQGPTGLISARLTMA